LNLIPLKRFYQNLFKELQMECPICFKKADYTTDCGHHFCKKCLYRWGDTCPLCRASLKLRYPNTRSMGLENHVIRNTSILLATIKRENGSENKIKYAEKLLDFLWEYRIVIRKYGHLREIVRERSAYIKKECIELGFEPPKIIKKTITI